MIGGVAAPDRVAAACLTAAVALAGCSVIFSGPSSDQQASELAARDLRDAVDGAIAALDDTDFAGLGPSAVTTAIEDAVGRHDGYVYDRSADRDDVRVEVYFDSQATAGGGIEGAASTWQWQCLAVTVRDEAVTTMPIECPTSAPLTPTELYP